MPRSKRQDNTEPMSQEAKQLAHEADLSKQARKRKEENKVVDTYYVVRNGRTSQDKKVIEKQVMSDGSKYSQLYVNFKHTASGKRIGQNEYNAFMDDVKSGKKVIKHEL